MRTPRKTEKTRTDAYYVDEYKDPQDDKVRRTCTFECDKRRPTG